MTCGSCPRCSSIVYRQVLCDRTHHPANFCRCGMTRGRASRDRFKREPGAVWDARLPFKVYDGARTRMTAPGGKLWQQTYTLDKKQPQSPRRVCVCGRYSAGKMRQGIFGVEELVGGSANPIAAGSRLVAVLHVHRPCMSGLPAPPPRATIAGVGGLPRPCKRLFAVS